MMDVGTLTGYLREAEKHHQERRAHVPEHHWSDWYAAYVDARDQGMSEDEACDHAGRYIQQQIRWP
jgi:hypothetical protein